MRILWKNKQPGVRGQDLVHQVRQEDHDGVDDSHVGVNGTVATGGLGVVPVADVTKNRNYQVFRNPINYLPICILYTFRTKSHRK